MRLLITILFTIVHLIAFSQPKFISFKPSVYYNNFSHKSPPVLRVQQGDTIKTESVDAGGIDKDGMQIAKRGNPLTGPFYIEGASPGDIIAIMLTDVSLNRDYATSVEGFVRRSLAMETIKDVFGRNAKAVKWKLDIKKGYATPQFASEHLDSFRIPLRPFLGCVGLAAPLESKEPLTYFADEYGGNMDFYKVTKGATIYIPVFHEGGLLYLGDGHAAQGDGEINGDALETSMDFAFVTRVIKGQPQIKFPIIEDAEHIVAIAMDKTLEDAIKKANQGLLEWLQREYSLTLKEITQVMGHLIEFRIPTLAGPKLEVAAMIKKDYLTRIKR